MLVQMVSSIPDGTIVVDAGAHVGTGMLLAHHLQKAGKTNVVYEIDPDKTKLDFIEAVARENNLTNVVTVHCGLSDKAGRGGRRVDPRMPHAAWMVNEDGDEFDVRRLDDVVGQHVSVGLIHFDLEGMEYKALQGASDILTRDRPPVIMEVIHDKEDAALSLLRSSHGYVAQWSGENNVRMVSKVRRNMSVQKPDKATDQAQSFLSSRIKIFCIGYNKCATTTLQNV